MNYYIKVNKGKEKEVIYELSEPFSTLEEAETKLKHLHKNNKKSAKIINIPEIKNGLNLFREGKYYRTIIGESKFVYFLDDINNPMDICDMVLKEHLQNWYIKGILNPIEEYAEGIDFKNVQDISGYVNDEVKNYEDEE